LVKAGSQEAGDFGCHDFVPEDAQVAQTLGFEKTGVGPGPTGPLSMAEGGLAIGPIVNDQ
jgi:hypothetical protein